MQIQNHISLKPYNTFGVEAYAEYFVEISSVEELKQVLQEYKNTPLLILGGGSNILLTQDFKGLAILLNLKGIEEKQMDNDSVIITAQASENWHHFVLYCLEKNYGGLENLSLIPGNVGTSPMQNIGAYGKEIKDVFHQCKALNIETLEVETFGLEQCKFGYRESFFKREGKGKYIILEVSFRLSTRNHITSVEYGAIQSELVEMGVQQPTIKDISNAVIRIRESKLPNPKEMGNAGSFFKNPTISQRDFEQLKEKYPNLPSYPNENGVKIPAGWLIEQAGWKGKQVGNVATHKFQALVIINATGRAIGKEIYDFSEEIIRSVEQKFGIKLEREVNII
ncbi:MAG: UDP-N-acetylmuramate dehydrogenase [Bergeyella zoohelcum]|nr:UDP-N-acetylmuramate dehydrogenase [Bergeyella zoohelcum]